ncbi:MAG: S9 family peptidase [Gemmatimonadota bacterium]|nr:S9 family peptidase [Candidatus Palauibacterales bacterium]
MQFYATGSLQLKHRFFTVLAALIFLGLASVATGQEKRTIRANDLFQVRTASSVVLSPDGRQVAFVVTQVDSADNAYYSHIWIASTDDRGARQYTHGVVRDRGPAWSPDGTSIAFVSNRGDDVSQIYILPVDGGEAWQLTEMEAGASNPVWAPDGRSLLFTSSLTTKELKEEGMEPPQAIAIGTRASASNGPGDDSAPGDTAMFGSMEAIRNWLARNASEEDPAVIGRLNFQGETSLDPIESWSHIFSIDLESKMHVRLTEGAYDFESPSFSSDGERIVLTARILLAMHPDYAVKSDLYVMSADGADLTKIDIPTHSVVSAQWAPSGNRIAFAGREVTELTAANNELGVVEISDGQRAGDITWLNRALDRGVREYHWSPDGRSIYFNARVHGTVPIYRVRVEDGQTRQIVSGERGALSFDLAERRLAYSITQPADPSEVYSANSDGDDERRLTELNTHWLSSVQVQPHQGFWYLSFDGKRVQGWTIAPVGYEAGGAGGKYPLAVEIHGGPHSMWGPGEATMWLEFQLLAAAGYMVLYTNPRGSSGYGYGFKLAIQRDWGDGPMMDVLTAVDSVVAGGEIDEERMVVAGGSYAGYLTAYIIGHDHRFKAAVAQRGVYDLATFFGEGNAWRLVPYEFDAYPWEDPEILREESPITYAHEITTPLLIMHSDNDLRTGVSQSEMLYRTLAVLHRPVEYVRYPRSGHDLSRTGEPMLRVDRLLRILEFFDRYVGGPRQTLTR